MLTSILLLMVSILLLLASLALLLPTSISILRRKIMHHLHYLLLSSFIFLMLGLALILAAILSILMPIAGLSSGTVTSYGYFGVVTGIVGAAIALVDAFLVKPYFRSTRRDRITGNNL